jgi:hypothetical protein
VEKTPEQLLLEQAEKAQKEEARKVKEAARLEVWNEFWPKYNFSKCKAFDSSRDAEFQITHYDIQPYDEEGLARFFAVRGIDYDNVKSRGSWMPPVQNSYPSVAQGTTAGGVSQTAAAGGYDNSQDALMAAAYRMLREQRPGNGMLVPAAVAVAKVREQVGASVPGGTEPIVIDSLEATNTPVPVAQVEEAVKTGLDAVVIDNPVAAQTAVVETEVATLSEDESMVDVPVIAPQTLPPCSSISSATTPQTLACPLSTHGGAMPTATEGIALSDPIIGDNKDALPLQQVQAALVP